MELARKLIRQVVMYQADKMLKKTTTLGLLLLGKWQEYRWTNNNIVSGLLDIMGNCARDTEKGRALLEWVVETVGLVSVHVGFFFSIVD